MASRRRIGSLRRALRVLLIGVGGVIGLLVVAVLLLALRPVRERALSAGLAMARSHLPGELVVAGARWPRLGRVELGKIVWTAVGDTLLSSESLSVTLDVSRLLQRDLRAERLDVVALRLDLPRLTAAFRDSVERPAEERQSQRDPFFPKRGALPGVPSFAIDTLVAQAARLRLAEVTTLHEVVLRGGCDFTRASGPKIHVEEARAVDPLGRWSLVTAGVEVDGVGGRLSGGASGTLGSLGEIDLQLATSADGRLQLQAWLGPSGATAEHTLRLQLDGTPERQGGRLHSLRFEADVTTPGTEDLTQWPEPFRRAAALPALDPVQLSIGGLLQLRPHFALDAHVTLTPNRWLEEARTRIRLRDGELVADSLCLGLPGARVVAHGRKVREVVDADLDLRVTDGRWLSILRPGITPPESLVAQARVHLSGNPTTPTIDAEIEGAMRRGAQVLDRVGVTASFPHGLVETGTVELSARSLGIDLATEAEFAVRTPWDVRLRPIELQVAEGSRPPAPGESRNSGQLGRIRFDPEARALEVESVRIVGALGDLELRAEVRGREATFAFDGRWMKPPALLPRWLALTDARWDSLRTRWSRDAPFHVAFEGTTRAEPEGTRLEAAGALHLPGPATLQSLFGSDVELDSLGPIDARVALDLLSSATGPEWDAEIDLSPTRWLRIAPLRARGTSNEITLDHTDLGFEDATLEFEAARRDSTWDARAHLLLGGLDAVGLFVPALRADSLQLDASASFRGTWRDATIELVVDGKAARGPWHLPRLQGRLERRAGRWTTAIEMPAGLTGPLPALMLDSVQLSFESQAADDKSLPGRLEFEARGALLQVAARATIERHGGLEIRADTLGIVLRGLDLRSTRPFEIRAGGHSRLEVDDLELQGTLGRLRASGSVTAGHVDMDADLSLALGGTALVPGLPAGVWPRAVDLSVRAGDGHVLRATGTIDDFALGGRTKLTARLEAIADTSGTSLGLRCLDGEREFLTGRVQLHDVWPVPATQSHGGSLEADVELHEFPVPWEFLGGAGKSIPAATADARLTAAGSLETLRADLVLELRAPLEPGPPARLQAVATYRPTAAPHTESDAVPESLRGLFEQLEGGGLAARLDLLRGERTDLEAQVVFPVQLAAGAAPSVDESRPLRIQMSAPKLDLAEWSPLLPRIASAQGRLASSFDIQGTIRDPELRGEATVADLALASSVGARVTGSGNVHVEGTMRRPVVQGEITVTSALIPIPENPRKLLPAEGDALLRTTTSAVPDSGHPASPDRDAPRPDSAKVGTSRIRPQIDVELVVPSSCWIRGRNMGVELGGKLRLQLADENPRVTGSLDARQGTLTLLGRTFELERGRVEFFGDDAQNPNLDVVLATKVSSTTVRIEVKGTAQKPEVELTSEPTLSQTDIMSLLVFGREPGELEGDELELVAQRSAAMAATWGAAELQSNLSGVGVDLFSVNPGGSPEGQSSVVVGKYLNERTLLKYEQALDNTTGFFVTLEYTLTRELKLQTLAGTWQSGAEINWSRDY